MQYIIATKNEWTYSYIEIYLTSTMLNEKEDYRKVHDIKYSIYWKLVCDVKNQEIFIFYVEEKATKDW